MEITSKYHKSIAISTWKSRGVIYHDFDELYEVYIKTMNCGHCGKEFPNTKYRHLDHDHETGMFRKIVCHKCNTNDSYINHPEGYDKKKANHITYEKHKQKRKEERYKKAAEKITCECASTYRRSDKSSHNRTLKHMDWWINSLD